MRIDVKNLFLGLALLSLGGFVLAKALTELPVGTAFRMGPGYFPTLLGGLLALFGALVALLSFGRTAAPFGDVSWRAVLLIGLAPVVFGVGIRGLGLAPTVALTSLVSVLAGPNVGGRNMLAVVTVLTAFCVLIFFYGLGLPIRLVGPWLGN